MCKTYEKYLFEDLDEFTTELLVNANSKVVRTTALKTKLTIKNLNSIWHQNTLRKGSTKRLMSQDSTDSIITETEIESEEEPESPPVMSFMPSKILLIKVILKAAFAEEKKQSAVTKQEREESDHQN